MKDEPRTSKPRSPAGDARRRLRRGVAAVALALLALAVVKEVRTPREVRTWHGTLFGFVPYDLRPPRLDRVRASLWAPDDDRFVVPRSFGVGWSPNLARLRDLARSARRPDADA
jgi:hypothetical protein